MPSACRRDSLQSSDLRDRTIVSPASPTSVILWADPDCGQALLSTSIKRGEVWLSVPRWIVIGEARDCGRDRCKGLDLGWRNIERTLEYVSSPDEVPLGWCGILVSAALLLNWCFCHEVRTH